MKRLRAGVIGVGHLGQHHARHYASLPGAILVGVFDSEATRAKLIAGRHGVQAWTDLNELLHHVEIVSVAAPTSAHFALTRACLEAGKHVLVEKPIAGTLAEARELVDWPHGAGACCRSGIANGSTPLCNACVPTSIGPPLLNVTG